VATAVAAAAEAAGVAEVAEAEAVEGMAAEAAARAAARAAGAPEAAAEPWRTTRPRRRGRELRMACLPPRDTSPHQDSANTAPSGTPPLAQPTQVVPPP